MALLSLLGIITFYLSSERIHSYLLPMVGFAAGALLGNAFFHLIPELVELRGTLDNTASLLLLTGILTFFLLEQGLRRWQSEHPDAPDHNVHLAHMAVRTVDDEHPAEVKKLLHARPFAVVNLGGELIHNFIDGLVVGGAFLVDIPLGLTTALVVGLHEIPHKLGDFAVLVQSGLTRPRAMFYSFMAALTVVVGGAVALLIGQRSELFPIYLIPFTAGSFIYLALGDLIPELHAHTRRGTPVSGVVGLLLGVAMMGLMETCMQQFHVH